MAGLASSVCQAVDALAVEPGSEALVAMGTDPAMGGARPADVPAGADSCRGLLYFWTRHLLRRDRYARVLSRGRGGRRKRTRAVSNGDQKDEREKQGER